jgi:hypothetical protein
MLARRRQRQLLGAATLIAVLLIPVALSGHTHVDSDARCACAICVLVHHAPAVGSSSLPTFSIGVPHFERIRGDVTIAPPRTDQAPGEGRAPPPPPVSVIV